VDGLCRIEVGGKLSPRVWGGRLSRSGRGRTCWRKIAARRDLIVGADDDAPGSSVVLRLVTVWFVGSRVVVVGL